MYMVTMAVDNLSFIFVFLEGIISFFSPCVIPLIPVYMSYLAGNAVNEGEEGVITYKRSKVFVQTLFFILGISFAFFILGISFTTLGNFFNNNKLLFTRIGGIFIIILGLFQLGILDFSFLQRERKIYLNLTKREVNPFFALLMGFTFSFSWTPCIGPALSSVLIMASGATDPVTGNLLVFIYAIGFLFPFLLLGLFTTEVLNFLKSKQNLLKYTIKTGGVILIIMGIMTFTGWMNGVSSYLNSISLKQEESQSNNQPNDEKAASDKSSNSTVEVDNEESSQSGDTDTQMDNDILLPAIDFTLTDQYGNEHTLSEYKGKVVFLNFWATWCPPCNKEMPHIEELYKEYGSNEDEVVFLGVANPKSEEYPNNQDEKKDDIIDFLETKGYTFPTVFDETGEIFDDYNINAFPTTFMIDKEGNVLGYVPGMMTKDIMINIINQTIKSTE